MDMRREKLSLLLYLSSISDRKRILRIDLIEELLNNENNETLFK